MKNRKVKVKQAVVALVAALLLALSMIGGPVLADSITVTGPGTNAVCWMCGG
jgi:hypothetical protein